MAYISPQHDAKKGIAELEYKDQKYYLPGTMPEWCTEQFEHRIVYEGKISGIEIVNASAFAEQKFELAVKMYADEKSEELEMFIRKSASEIGKYLVENHKIEELSKFLSWNMLDKAGLNRLHDLASISGDATAMAYITNSIEERRLEEADSDDMRL